MHAYLTQPQVTEEDRMSHAIQFLSAALKYVPNSICNSQLAAIEAVRTIFANWQKIESLPPISPKVVPPPPKPIVPIRESAPIRYPAPTSKGEQGRDRVTTSKGASKQQTLIISKKSQVAANSKGYQEPIPAHTRSLIDSSAKILPFRAIRTLGEPVAAQTRYNTLSHNYTTPSHSRAFAEQLLTHLAYSVLDHDTGK